MREHGVNSLHIKVIVIFRLNFPPLATDFDKMETMAANLVVAQETQVRPKVIQQQNEG